MGGAWQLTRRLVGEEEEACCCQWRGGTSEEEGSCGTVKWSESGLENSILKQIYNVILDLAKIVAFL